MKCPHCLQNFHHDWQFLALPDDADGRWFSDHTKCPACGRLVVDLRAVDKSGRCVERRTVRPAAPSRTPLSADVPEVFAADYREACLVLTHSPKASAALSRRCLEGLLREKAGATARNLAEQIEQVLKSGSLPSHLADAIDSVRVLGSFPTHPIKSQSTGEIVDVEPGEAEWLLDTLESLFDFYFVAPALLKQKKEALNKKLSDTGKPLVK